MAAENIIARFESKMDSVVRMQNVILWVIGVAFALIAALNFIPVQ